MRVIAPGASPRSGVVPPVSTRFKPGVSGHPGGRPVGVKYLSAHLREQAAKLCNNPNHKDHGPLTNDECIARVITRAARGDFDKGGRPDLWATTIYAERTEGKVKDVLQVTRESSMPDKTDAEVADMLKNAERQAEDEPKGIGE